MIVVEFVGPDSSRGIECHEQACREFSRDTGSLRLNSKGSANRIYGPCGLPLTEHNTVTTAAMDHLSTGEFYRYWPAPDH